MTEKFLNKLNICEKWKAGKEVIIPAGAVAYHLGSQRKYSAGEKLKRADRHGYLLVCRKSFSVQLREVPVVLRRGEAGPSVHLAWCSLGLKVKNMADLSTELGTEQSLSFDELDERLTQSLEDTLPEFEGFDLTALQSHEAVEINIPTKIKIDLLKGLSVERFVLRRVLTKRDYFEQEICLEKFRKDLADLAYDKRIWRETEKDRRDQALAKLENDKVLMLLTSDEKKMSLERRFKKYLELLGPITVTDPKGEEQRKTIIELLIEIRDRLVQPLAPVPVFKPTSIHPVLQEDEYQDEEKEIVDTIKPVSHKSKGIFRTDFGSGNTQFTTISGSSKFIKKPRQRDSMILQIDGSKGKCRIIMMSDSKKFKNDKSYSFLVKLKTKKGGKVYLNAYCPLRKVGQRKSDPTVFFATKEVEGANKWQPIEGKMKTLSVSDCRYPCDCSKQGCISARGCTVELGVVTSDQNFLIDSIDINKCPEEA
jgi:hypothetical protein